jgi:hypothetical protein
MPGSSGFTGGRDVRRVGLVLRGVVVIAVIHGGLLDALHRRVGGVLRRLVAVGLEHRLRRPGGADHVGAVQCHEQHALGLRRGGRARGHRLCGGGAVGPRARRRDARRGGGRRGRGSALEAVGEHREPDHDQGDDERDPPGAEVHPGHPTRPREGPVRYRRMPRRAAVRRFRRSSRSRRRRRTSIGSYASASGVSTMRCRSWLYRVAEIPNVSRIARCFETCRRHASRSNSKIARARASRSPTAGAEAGYARAEPPTTPEARTGDGAVQAPAVNSSTRAAEVRA